MRKINTKVKRIFKNIKRSKFGTIVPLAVVTFVVGSFTIGIVKSLIIVGIITLSPIIIENRFIFGKKEKGGEKSKNKKQKRKAFRIAINICLSLAALGIVIFIGFMTYIVFSAPSFNEEKLYKKEASVVYDSDGKIIAKLGSQLRDKIAFDDLPQVFVDAIIATEDSRFYQHNGFDLPRFIKASFGQLLGNSSAGGASTITMQVVKNNLTNVKQTITRKFTDIYMAMFKIEKVYSKEEILEFYVNAPYLGGTGAGAYGVAEASRMYFGKEIKDLNLSEAALLAGLFQAPGYYNPFYYPERAEARRSTVLYLMRRHGYITKEEEDFANSIPVKDLLTNTSSTINEYQTFIDMVINEVEDKTEKSPYNVAMNIYTTLDRNIQDHVNDVMNGEKFTWANDLVQAGVAITSVKDGSILALGGGRNVNVERGFSFATDLDKQPGSTAKPIFDYGPGVEYENWSTYTPFIDETHGYSNGMKIKNWDGRYMGFLTLKKALGLSRNIPALKAFQSVNNKDILNFVTSLGMDPEIENGKIHEAHALGAFTGTNPLQMAAAYASFGNGGYYIKPYTITKIEYIETHDEENYTPVKNKVMADSTAYIITNALTWAVDSGLSSGVRINGYQVAAKTGTTNFDEKTIQTYGIRSDAVNDLWTIGYTPEYSMGLWYGYDTINKKYVNTAIDTLKKDKLFSTILKGIISGTTKTFKVPDSVIAVKVENETIPGMLPSEYTPSNMITTEYFKEGTEPTEVSTRYAKLDNVDNLQVNSSGNSVTISWDKIETPTYYTDEYMQSFYSQYYGESYTSYLNSHKNKIAAEMGVLGYDVYYKDSNGATYSLGTTTDSSITVNKPNALGNITFIVKTAFSIFKNNASSGSEFSFANNNTSSIDISLVGEANKTIQVNTVYAQVNPPVSVYDVINQVDVTSKCTIESKITHNGTTSTLNNSFTPTSTGTYTITYVVTYNGSTYTPNIKRTLTVIN